MPWGNTEILASCPVQDAKLLEPMKALGCDTMHCNKSLLGKSDVVVLAVKPNVSAYHDYVHIHDISKGTFGGEIIFNISFSPKSRSSLWF